MVMEDDENPKNEPTLTAEAIATSEANPTPEGIQSAEPIPAVQTISTGRASADDIPSAETITIVEPAPIAESGSALEPSPTAEGTPSAEALPKAEADAIVEASAEEVRSAKVISDPEAIPIKEPAPMAGPVLTEESDLKIEANPPTTEPPHVDDTISFDDLVGNTGIVDTPIFNSGDFGKLKIDDWTFYVEPVESPGDVSFTLAHSQLRKIVDIAANAVGTYGPTSFVEISVARQQVRSRAFDLDLFFSFQDILRAPANGLEKDQTFTVLFSFKDLSTAARACLEEVRFYIPAEGPVARISSGSFERPLVKGDLKQWEGLAKVAGNTSATEGSEANLETMKWAVEYISRFVKEDQVQPQFSALCLRDGVLWSARQSVAARVVSKNFGSGEFRISYAVLERFTRVLGEFTESPRISETSGFFIFASESVIMGVAKLIHEPRDIAKLFTHETSMSLMMPKNELLNALLIHRPSKDDMERTNVKVTISTHETDVNLTIESTRTAGQERTNKIVTAMTVKREGGPIKLKAIFGVRFAALYAAVDHLKNFASPTNISIDYRRQPVHHLIVKGPSGESAHSEVVVRALPPEEL